MKESLEDFNKEYSEGKRFGFGDNWKDFLKVLNAKRITEAENTLKEMLEVDNLEGKTFLDIGSGSGLFSLAARNLGASVLSFDYDPSSVWCTKELRNKFYEGDDDWVVSEGSVLNSEYIDSLGKFDIVYSWGVLHHTGDMWKALSNVKNLVNVNGRLFIALYNHQQFASFYWSIVKKLYVKTRLFRPILIFIHLIYPTLPSILIKLIKGKKPPRGMTYWYDLKDWLGGYPFETSTPSEVFEYHKINNYKLTKLKTVGAKMGCNEFVFIKI